MRKLLLVTAVVVGLVCGGTAWAEWVQVDQVINGNTFIATSGEVVNIIGLSRTPKKHMTKFFFEDNDVWIERKTIDDSGRTFAVVDLHGATSYSQIVDDHKYDKSSDTIISKISDNKYYCNETRYHRKSPHPYSLPGGRRIRRMAKNHRQTWGEVYGTPVEVVELKGFGSSYNSDYSSNGRRNTFSSGNRSQIRQLKGQISAIDKKIANANSSVDFNANLRHPRSTRGKQRHAGSLSKQRQILQEQLNDLQLIDAGADPSGVMSRRRDSRDATVEREEMRSIARDEAQAAANARTQHYIAHGQ